MPVFADAIGSLGALERWLLPGECLLCRGGLGSEPGGLVCTLCRSRWTRLPEPQCPRCGEPQLLTELACRLCAEWPEGLDRARSAVWHDGGARHVVHLLKYEGWWRVTEAMAEAMRGLVSRQGRLFLVPIPLSPRRRASRGYNQSEYLAHALGRLAGLEVRADVLRRVRETPTQTALTPDARLANVAGAFVARPLRGQPVLLVDDVFTTGATLLTAAAALKGAGAAQVEAVTFARARPSLEK